MQKSAYKDIRGAALLFAVVMLALLSTLGTMYVRHMYIEMERTDFSVRQSRARQLSVAGINAALGDLVQALQAGQEMQIVAQPRTYTFPTYKKGPTSAGLGLTHMDTRRAEATVTVTDESGKVNLNHAPASVLQAVLGVDGATARRITSSLPRNDAHKNNADEAQKQWLLSIDDLLTRGLLSKAQFDALDRSLITTYSVTDHDDPSHYLNINTAPVEVMAAILDIPIEAAKQVVVRRPFKTFAALVAVSGKDPMTFNIKPDAATPEKLPAPLALQSRCFHLTSTAEYAYLSGETAYNTTTAHVDTLVSIPEYGQPEILRWRTDSQEQIQAATEPSETAPTTVAASK